MIIFKAAVAAATSTALLLSSAAYASETRSGVQAVQLHALTPASKVKRKVQPTGAYASSDSTSTSLLAGVGGLAVGVGACFAISGCGNASSASTGS